MLGVKVVDTTRRVLQERLSSLFSFIRLFDNQHANSFVSLCSETSSRGTYVDLHSTASFVSVSLREQAREGASTTEGWRVLFTASENYITPQIYRNYFRM